MSFEMMLVNSAGAQKAPAQESQAKSKPTGTESAFQALMSLAMTALFGEGAETEGVAEGEAAVVEASGEQAAQVTVDGADTGEFWAPKGGMTENTLGGQGSSAAGESRSEVKAQVAGPVEVAKEVTETGGHAEPAIKDLLHSTSSNALMAAQRTATNGKIAVSALPESSASESLTTRTEVEHSPAFTVSAAETTDAAVAPDFRFHSYGGRDAVPPADKSCSSSLSRQAEADVEAALPTGERAAVAAKAGVSMPESKVLAPESATSTTKVVVADQIQPRVREGESFAGADETDTEETPVQRQSSETRVTLPEFTLDPKISAPRSGQEQPAVNKTNSNNEAAETRALLDARAISQTLLEESMRRLPRSVELRMDPPELGSVTALLSQRGQDVTVKFVAHSNDAQRMLQGATDDLARSLGEKGLVLTGFSVDPGYRDDRGQERRDTTGRPSPGRYRPTGLASTGASAEVRQATGSFNWLA